VSHEFLLDRFAAADEGVAFVDDDVVFTYRWILDRIPRYEAFLDAAGIQRGDIVCLVADYSPEVFCFLIAALGRGIVLAPLTRESVVERDAVIEVSECQWFLEFGSGADDIAVTPIQQTATNPVMTEFIARGLPGLLLFSSGSTGKPKGILHDFDRVLEKFRTPRPSVVGICFLMLDHFGGINTLFHILSTGGTVVTVRKRSVKAICAAIEAHRVELLPATPSFLNILVRSDALSRYDLSSLNVISYGTEVMPQSTLDRLRLLFPDVKLQQTYGLSELGVLRSQSRPDGTLWFKIGGKGFQTKIVDDILWIKSDFAMVGYLNAPSPFDADGWFNTQDRVEVDGDYVKILGRTTDLMNIGGQKVYPSEIEDVIIRLDNVEDVGVYSEENALLGSIVVARVVLRTPEDADALRKRVRTACRAELAPYKVPTKVLSADSDLYSKRLKKMRPRPT
jgi:acyl-CoA synthetase (AMP-forming)/AMP-acid ligase II